MTIALSPTITPTVNLKPLAKQIPIHQWQRDLDYLENEVVFYQKLLKMGSRNCPSHTKATMYRLLDKFSGYLDSTIPELKSELAAFDKNGAEHAQAFSFQKKLEHHRLGLRKLKESVFPHVNNLQKFSIW